mgnify:CR=1 FL=1
MIQLRMRFLAILVMLAAVAFAAPEAHGQDPIEWEMLRGVDWEHAEGTYTPVFTDDVERLDETTVRITGYMIPIAISSDMNHFLLTSQPSRGCPYCRPGGPSTMIEVRANEEMSETTYDPLTVTGTLHLIKDDPSGLVYRIVEAEVTK